MPTPGLDPGGVTPELKLRLKYYYSRTWRVFLFVCSFLPIDFFLLVLLLWVFYFYFYSYYLFSLSILSTLSSSSHPYTHPLHSPSFSCAKTHCSLQQLILSCLIHSLPSALTFSSNSPTTCHQTPPPSFTCIIH
jgi:hypothetical protein